MSDFSSNLPSSKLDSSQKEQLMEQVKAQIAVANAQEILHVSHCLNFSDDTMSCVVLEVKASVGRGRILTAVNYFGHRFRPRTTVISATCPSQICHWRSC